MDDSFLRRNGVGLGIHLKFRLPSESANFFIKAGQDNNGFFVAQLSGRSFIFLKFALLVPDICAHTSWNLTNAPPIKLISWRQVPAGWGRVVGARTDCHQFFCSVAAWKMFSLWLQDWIKQENAKQHRTTWDVSEDKNHNPQLSERFCCLNFLLYPHFAASISWVDTCTSCPAL